MDRVMQGGFLRSRAWDEGSGHMLYWGHPLKNGAFGEWAHQVRRERTGLSGPVHRWMGQGHHRTGGQPLYSCVTQSLAPTGDPPTVYPIRKVSSCDPLAPTLTAPKGWYTQPVKGSRSAPCPLLHICGADIWVTTDSAIVATSTLKPVWVDRW